MNLESLESLFITFLLLDFIFSSVLETPDFTFTVTRQLRIA
jgi:hypothetical protein